MHLLDDWRVQDIESKVNRKAESHEVSTLSSNVDSLECALRESRAEVDGLRSRVLELETQVEMFREMRNWWRQTYAGSTPHDH